MIPKAVGVRGPWKVLPAGVHDATLLEVEERFATNAARRKLFDGFTRGVDALRRAGCRIVYLDGSYVSEKPHPADYDVCWDTAGVDPAKLDPVLLDYSDGRRRQKEKYAGEFFPADRTADGRHTFVDFFQTDKHTGKKKGILRIRVSPE